MRRPCRVFALCACLAACATPATDPPAVATTERDALPANAVFPSPPAPAPNVSKTTFGMFVGIGPPLENQLADEAAFQLARIYPPRRYLLDFQQRILDGFGPRLMSALQRDGYFVRQWHSPGIPPRCGNRLFGGEGAVDTFVIVPACYLVDDLDGLLRLTLYIGGSAWSRFFAEEEGKLRPAGAWTQQNDK